jgi:hypothetical protein
MILIFSVSLYSAENVEDITVKADANLEIVSDKPEIQINYDKDELFNDFEETKNYVFDVSPKSLVDVLPAVTKVVYSNNTVAPEFVSILKNPILKFKTETLKKHFVEKWTLVVTDARGEVFHKMKGKKDFPTEMEWDGKNHKGEMLVPGEWYSYLIELEDSYGDKHVISGETFKVKGVYYEDKKRNQIISLSLMDVFDLNSPDPIITNTGQELLRETLDYLKIFYEYPLKIVVYDVDEVVGYIKKDKQF